jgi:hypothetical protein
MAEKADSSETFDELARNWRANRDGLSAVYNMNLPQTSILENREGLEELEKHPGNRGTELAIRAFLFFIFAGLLLLKLLAPDSVRRCFSEVLQHAYVRYAAEAFDEFLHPVERSKVNPSLMSPQRLYDFLAPFGSPFGKPQPTARRPPKVPVARS